MAKDTRQQFRSTWQLVTDWLTKAEGRDVTDLDVVTYETLDDQLQQHKVGGFVVGTNGTLHCLHSTPNVVKMIG